MSEYRRIATLKTASELRARLIPPPGRAIIGLNGSPKTSFPHLPTIPEQADPKGILGQAFIHDGRRIGNRFAILPMEGWDASEDGKPTDLTIRRWKRFGGSGSKMIWGTEAVTVRHDGRANPNQLVLSDANLSSIADLRKVMVDEHRSSFGTTEDLVVGLQLTHSGRFARPNKKDRFEPFCALENPILDRRYNIQSSDHMASDADLDQLVGDFVAAAARAQKAGFDFVDLKHCHGYLGHELLAARHRPGKYGGSLENRMRFLREIVSGIRANAPGLRMGVRLSIFDTIPHKPGADRVGVPDGDANSYDLAFGPIGPHGGIDLSETVSFLTACRDLGITWICTTAGSPYYTPHLQRPAQFPPSDGYLPPEDPCVGVARQVSATAKLKELLPELLFVGSGYSFLQDWLPQVGEAVVGAGMVDMIGLGRMILAYPDLPADFLSGKGIDRKRICRTFSDCTTAPRKGMISGCFPLDPFYKIMPEAEIVRSYRAGVGP